MNSSRATAAIGLFDSGIGGLTVLRAVREALPNENLIYLGDTARLPYGSKSPETIKRYLEQNIRFLEKRGVKAVVVACNSASSVLDDGDLKFNIPVYGVIGPGAASALAVSTNARIGVLGTRATISGGAYARAINALNPQAVVLSQACPLLVPLVEEGWENDPLTNLVVFRYVSPLLAQGIDTLILGCTHYPALVESIRKVVGPHIALVDSSDAIAKRLISDLQNGHLHPNPSTNGKFDILVTDSSPAFAEVATRLMHPHSIGTLTPVDIA